jgi:hypothetical protein
MISAATLCGGHLFDALAQTVPDLRNQSNNEQKAGTVFRQRPDTFDQDRLAGPGSSDGLAVGSQERSPAGDSDDDPANPGETQETQRPGNVAGSATVVEDTTLAGTQASETDAFRWGGALKQSMFFLGIMHGFRMATEPTSRAELRGPFFKDYFAAVRSLRGWGDGDPFIVNYIGHPIQGAVTGYIQIHNDPKAVRQDLEMNKTYWKSRFKAMGWAALFSTQFELGLVSEASLGNIGINPSEEVKHPMEWVDLVVTPTLGTAWLVGEDILDRYLVRPIEKRISNRLVRLLVRSIFNPSRSMANVLRMKYPWHREDRRLRR